MGPIGWPELLIILVVVLLLFGTTRLAGLGKASGKAIREFKEETRDMKNQEAQPEVMPAPQATSPQAQPSAPAQPMQPAPQQLPYQQQYPAQQGYPGQPSQYPQPGVVYDAEVVDPERPAN